MAGCAATTPSLDDDPAVVARRIAARVPPVQVVYLGESHDNPYHHLDQARVIEAMLAGGARPALAFEMLVQTQQEVVDAAMLGSAGGAALGTLLRWDERGWPAFDMYRPLFDLARRDGLPVVALDLDQSVARRIAKSGLGALAAEERNRLASRLTPDPRREHGIARDIEAAHCGLLPAGAVPGMVDAWHARNVTMARRILQALERAPQVVVIVGRGHQAPGGLADQVDALRPGTRQLIVDLVEAGGEGPGQAGSDDRMLWRMAGQSVGRIVWPTRRIERPDPCAPLRNR